MPHAALAALLVVCLTRAFAPAAAANVPAAVTKTNPVRVPALGNAAGGSLTTTVTYASTAASATASTGNTIGLGHGYLFRLRIPFAQITELADAMHAADPAAYVDDVQLAKGTIAFGHGGITRAALDDFNSREKLLVAPVDAPTVPLDKR
jgi:hypothetical protein